MDESEPSVYEQLCISLYAYRLGMISFLELLDRFEEALHIRPPQTEPEAV